jgi:hypothetical protein
MNPAPDAELASVGEFYHNWILNAVIDLVFKRLVKAAQRALSLGCVAESGTGAGLCGASAAEQQARTIHRTRIQKSARKRRNYRQDYRNRLQDSRNPELFL